MTTENKAAALLSRWLESGALASQYDRFVDTSIKTSTGWYKQIETARGVDAAEASLAKWNRDLRVRDFSRCIVGVARGLMEFSLTDSFSGSSVVTVDRKKARRYPCLPGYSENTEMVLFMNQRAYVDDSPSLPGYHNWASGGTMGLKAVTLDVCGDRYTGFTASLGLVLPYRASREGDLNQDGFVVATIDSSGYSQGHWIYPQGFNPNGYLNYSLGLTSLESSMRHITIDGGHLDEFIGFPGALNYLADNLPELGYYLSGLAARRAANKR